MSLIGTMKHYYEFTLNWSIENGLSDWHKLIKTKDLTGIFDSRDHWLHFFCWSDLRKFLESYNCNIIGAAASNSLTNHNIESLTKIEQDPKIWKVLLKTELDFCLEPGNYDSGTHIIAIVQKSKTHPRK
jgi:hypothetical protein